LINVGYLTSHDCTLALPVNVALAGVSVFWTVRLLSALLLN